MFTVLQQPQERRDIEPPPIADIEDTVAGRAGPSGVPRVTTAVKRKRGAIDMEPELDTSKSWREVLGDPPSKGNTRVSNFHIWD